jgi:hypothetical protein
MPQDPVTGFPTPNKSSTEDSPDTNAESSAHSPVPWGYAPAPATAVVAEVQTASQSPATSLDPAADVEVARLVDVFRAQMAPQFPFVVIPPHVSARELCAENPFLYRAIVVVASCKNAGRQIILRKEMMREICERVLMESQKTLELLRGLLVFIAW